MESDLVIGIGDLHGHYPALESLLVQLDKKYRIFQSKGKLRENVVLVSTGDYIDRGKDSLKIIEILMQLQQENPLNVHELIGNHELIALGSLNTARELSISSRYGLPLLYKETSAHGQEGGNSFIKCFGNGDTDSFRKYVKRMSKDGDIGKWIRNLDPFYTAEQFCKRILFIHAGIPYHIENPSDLESSLSDYKKIISSDSEDNNRYFRLACNNAFSSRELIKGEIPKDELEETLKRANLDYIVFGHSIQEEGRIKNYFDRAFGIDVGMTPYYGTHDPAAIVFKQDGIFAFYVQKGEFKLI